MKTQRPTDKPLPPDWPEPQGLWDPAFEKDGCGVGAVVQMSGEASHGLIEHALELNANMAHRSKNAPEPESGDGAGILLQMPHSFLKKAFKAENIALPEPGHYALGVVFLDKDPQARAAAKSIVEHHASQLGCPCLGWRGVQVQSDSLSSKARAAEPCIEQVALKRPDALTDPRDWEMQIYRLRLAIEASARAATATAAPQAHPAETSASANAAANAANANAEAAANANAANAAETSAPATASETAANAPANANAAAEATSANANAEAAANANAANAAETSAPATASETAANAPANANAAAEATSANANTNEANANAEAPAPSLPANSAFHIVSFSSQTLTYKGMLLPEQLATYFPELRNPEFKSAMAIVHGRYATHTFAGWSLAQPSRMSAFSGTLNTIKANKAAMEIRLAGFANSADSANLANSTNATTNAAANPTNAATNAEVPTNPATNSATNPEASANSTNSTNVATNPATNAATNSTNSETPTNPAANATTNPTNPTQNPEPQPFMHANSSEAAAWDGALEWLCRHGFNLAEAGLMLLPQAWEHDKNLPESIKAFYQYHDRLMEAWDGPAAFLFCDGRYLGARVDRSGLRGLRYCQTQSGLLIAASELSGLKTLQGDGILSHGRVAPGDLLLVDTASGALVSHAALEQKVFQARPYGQWLQEQAQRLDELPEAEAPAPLEPETRRAYQRSFGYSFEDLRFLMGPTAETATQPLGSMGIGVPLAVLSKRPRLLYDYFKQIAAQVTNNALDSIRESLTGSTRTYLGCQGNLLEPSAANARCLELNSPLLTPEQLARIAKTDFSVARLPMYFDADAEGTSADAEGNANAVEGKSETAEAKSNTNADALLMGLQRLFKSAEAALSDGASLLILSDRKLSAQKIPIPALLAVSALHQHLCKKNLRSKASLILETGEAREIHHFASLLGFGADAICPWLALETLMELCETGNLKLTASLAQSNYLKGSLKGIVKTMAKLGINTLGAYRHGQLFEPVGLSTSALQYFNKATARVGGIGLEALQADAMERHHGAFQATAGDTELSSGGIYQWRKDGEQHAFSPDSVRLLHTAVRENCPKAFAAYAHCIDAPELNFSTLRACLAFKKTRKSIPIDQVEPAEGILKRFKTGAISFGSISKEAHETMALAMNRIGGKSNSGEGGEDPERLKPLPNGDSKRSAIKQVASGRFGVNAEYLRDASELQIKLSQGAKPGEGGELPGKKVYPWIARVRHATAGVSLASPPNHHDLNSPEDLGQLIHDLRAINPKARINVKLTAGLGIGAMAAVVAKAGADVILISGHDGGTGASPLSSIYHAGLPWELGLAEAQQTLLLNGLRAHVRLEADGQLKTGRDVAIAALLGAEEFGFATTALVSMGCLMMRVCHKNTCPVGVATQDPRLRKNFTGKAEHVVRFMYFIAEHLRSIMAELGFAKLDSMVGQAECLEPAELAASQSLSLDFSNILHVPELPEGAPRRFQSPLAVNPQQFLDVREILPKCEAIFGPLATNALASQATEANATNANANTVANAANANAAAPANANAAAPANANAAAPANANANAAPAARKDLSKLKPVELRLPINNADRSVGTYSAGCITELYGPEGLPEDSLKLRFEGVAGQSFGAFGTSGMTMELVGAANDYMGKGLSGATLIVRPDGSASQEASQNVIAGNVCFYGATAGKAFIAGACGERFCVRNSGITAVLEGLGDHGCEYMTAGKVVVLGPVGRNFAAGMSGGTAYVLDEKNNFERYLNPDTVNIYRLAEAGKAEIKAVAALIEEHAKHTGSAKAKQVLGRWSQSLSQIVKVLPKDYERMLRSFEAMAERGLKGEAAVMAAFEESLKAV